MNRKKRGRARTARNGSPPPQRAEREEGIMDKRAQTKSSRVYLGRDAMAALRKIARILKTDPQTAFDAVVRKNLRRLNGARSPKGQKGHAAARKAATL